MWKLEFPAIASHPLQAICREWQIPSGRAHNRSDNTIQAVGNHNDAAAIGAAKLNELWKIRVNLDVAQELIDFRRLCSHQIDLLTHAYTRR
jgi:hypothetical protein